MLAMHHVWVVYPTTYLGLLIERSAEMCGLEKNFAKNAKMELWIWSFFLTNFALLCGV